MGNSERISAKLAIEVGSSLYGFTKTRRHDFVFGRFQFTNKMIKL